MAFPGRGPQEVVVAVNRDRAPFLCAQLQRGQDGLAAPAIVDVDRPSAVREPVRATAKQSVGPRFNPEPPAPQNPGVTHALAYWMLADIVTQPALVQIEHVEPTR
jgi:hypothetical protein